MKSTRADELGDLAIDVLRLQDNYEHQPRDRRDSPEYERLGREIKALRSRVLRAMAEYDPPPVRRHLRAGYEGLCG